MKSATICAPCQILFGFSNQKGPVARIREKKNAYRILARKLEGNRPLKRKRKDVG